MPKTIHPLVWIRTRVCEDFEDAHTCPWCGETFALLGCEDEHLFRESTDRPEHEDHSDAAQREEQ